MQAKLLTLCMALCAVCLTATSQNVPDYVPTDGLVAWWPMNGNVDDAIGSLDGFNQGGVETNGPDGQIGQALELPSGDDYIDLPTGGVSEEGGLTLAFWAWLELPAEGAAPLIDRIEVSNNLWSFSYEQSSETVHFITRNNDGSGYHNLSTWSPPAAEWVHVTSVYRAPSGLKELHVNGSIVGAELAPLEGFTMPTMRLGEVAEGTWNSNCRFSEVGIWSRSLTEEEILALYNAQLPVPGCTDSIACNFNAEANNEDDSCVYPLFGEDCETGGAACGEGTIWDVNIQACVVPEFCQEDLDGDGVIGVNDLMQLLSVYATDCEAEDVDPELDEFTCGGPLNYQGYDYATVQIGEQCWFAENLRNQKYANGDLIPDNLDDVQWSSTDFGATSIYGEDSSDCYGPCDEIENLDWHGRLYNFEAIQDPRGLCPSGWSPPSETDVLDLIGYYGGVNLAGPDLAAEGAWGVGTGESGLDVVPQGWRNPSGYFSLSGDFYLWTSTEGLPNESSFLRVAYQGSILVDQISQWFGMSARCLKDTE
jgi:uncharacterized protein (TIGR02145 family)